MDLLCSISFPSLLYPSCFNCIFKVLSFFAFPCADKHQVSHAICYFASPLNNKMCGLGAIVVWYSGMERIVEKASIRLPELLHIHVSPPELLSWLISGLFQHSVSGQFIGMNHSHGNCNLEQRCTGARWGLPIPTKLNRLKSDQLSPKKRLRPIQGTTLPFLTLSAPYGPCWIRRPALDGRDVRHPCPN